MVEEAYLESAGFETRILSEGTEVEGVIEKEHFDLILLDLMLPGKMDMRSAVKFGTEWISPFLWSLRGQNL